MPRILMLQPLYVYRRWPMPHEFMSLIAHCPTLAFAQLRSCLKDYEVDYIDGGVQDLSLDELTRRASAADAVFVNAHSSIGAFNAEANIRHILDTCPGKPVIMGGHHATVYDYEWLGRGAHVIVRNEGEETIVELMEAIFKGGSLENIKGISWRDADRGFHRNPSRPLAPDLDKFPVPDWSIFDPKLYDLPLAGKGYAGTIESSRGCGFRCKFCAASEMWDHTQRFKSPERVLEELRVMWKAGYDRLLFSDDNFGAEPARYEKIYEGMIREGMKFNFISFMRVDTIVNSPETVKLAYKAGFRAVLLGIESPSERLLKDFDKSLSFEQSKKAVEILRANGVFIAGFFMVGYLGQSQEETDDTYRAAVKMADYPIISIFEPRFGTDDFSRARVKMDLPTDDMFYFNTAQLIPSQLHVRDQNRNFHLKYFLHPEQYRKMLFGTPTQKAWFRNLYWNMFKSVISGTPSLIARPWKMVRYLY